jgi:hypothetical protein
MNTAYLTSYNKHYVKRAYYPAIFLRLKHMRKTFDHAKYTYNITLVFRVCQHKDIPTKHVLCNGLKFGYEYFE